MRITIYHAKGYCSFRDDAARELHAAVVEAPDGSRFDDHGQIVLPSTRRGDLVSLALCAQHALADALATRWRLRLVRFLSPFDLRRERARAAQRAEIMRLDREGVSYAEIGRRMNLTPGFVWHQANAAS